MGTSYLGRGRARFAVVAIQKAGQAGQRPTRWKMSPSVGGVVTWYALFFMPRFDGVTFFRYDS